ncbi:MAG: Uma2 family endonuclease [Spirochaetota bacterium]
MGEAAMQLAERFSYGEYKTWEDDKRWELIDGLARMMAAPSTSHQRVSMRLAGELHAFLKGKPCEVLTAPFDVLLPERDEEDDETCNVVQPDIVVFCDSSRIRKANARGAPDLAMEILSPSSSKWDQNDKFRLYERMGVREYWIIDPAALSICVYRLQNGHFDQGSLREQFHDWSRIGSSVLADFGIDPGELFAELE